MSVHVIQTAFASLRRRVKLGLAIEAAALAMGGLLVYMAVTLPVDRWLRLERIPRLLLLATGVALLIRFLARRVFAPLRVKLDDDELALAVERAEPGLGQQLISAVQFRRRLEVGSPGTPDSPELMRHVVASIDTSASSIRFGKAVDAGRISKLAAVAVVSGLLLAAVSLAWPGTFFLWAARNLGLSSVEWPRMTALSVDGFDSDVIRLPEGDDLTVLVRARGVVPEIVDIRFRYQGGGSGSEPMTQTGAASADGAVFSYTFSAVIEPFTFYAEGGDGITSERRIELVHRPKVRDLALTVHFPDYMARPPALLPPTEGDHRVVRGSRLGIAALSTKQLKKAFVLHGKERRDELTIAADRLSTTGEFTPQETGLFAVDLLDTDDLTTGQPPRILIRVVEDKEPRVTWKPQGIGSMVTPFARIPGKLTARDDFGLAGVGAELRVTSLGGPAAPEAGSRPAGEPEWLAAQVGGLESFRATNDPFEVDPTLLNLETALNPDMENLDAPANKAPPGHLLSIRFSAKDNFGPGAPHVGMSEVVTLRVVTPAELLNDLLLRQQEKKREFEALLKEERADRAELREILPPQTPGAVGEKVRSRISYLARHQRSIGRRVMGVGDGYQQILDEMRNNRLVEPAQIRELENRIVEPLAAIADQKFPPSVELVTAFCETGTEDLRSKTIAVYDDIIRVMERVLQQMESLETFLRVINQLREVIKEQDAASGAARARLKAVAEDIFGPESKPAAGDPKDGGQKNR